LLHECNKSKNHIPIRQLIKRAGRTVQHLKPCFMMGPLSVAQYLEQGAIEFDLVIMDEASQIRPEEALGAIARSKQLVVVGDSKQLPPTSFFDFMISDPDEEDENETPAVLEGTESILDICQRIFHPARTLRWHYRSRHQSLIAFSNDRFYNNELLVFPAPYDSNSDLGVTSKYIENGFYQGKKNQEEALSVVKAVLAHMKSCPNESLGVVTLNAVQRDLISELLDKNSRENPYYEKFIKFHEDQGWSFFIKNLENVQGDERDVIFVSTTFGKAEKSGKLLQNFGPISQETGWRRLNVLFTRARKKIVVFTSMLPEDIVIADTTKMGTKALKDYLTFAQSGELPAVSGIGKDFTNDFEKSVGNMLIQEGYDIVPQYGVARFFIDLAVRNPARPREFLAAVECDGASYHSSKSARDRDRLRQAILEDLGWKNRIWRIWSTDWFSDPHSQSEKLLDFLKQRRRESFKEHAEFLKSVSNKVDLEEPELSPLVELSNSDMETVLEASSESLHVEVGDTVMYRFTDDPKGIFIKTIVTGPSNAEKNLINEETALALALLGTEKKQICEMKVPDNPKGRSIEVLRVIRR